MMFFNKTECPICGKGLKEADEIISFPPFTSNMKDPLFEFGESAVHEECLESYPSKDKILYFKDKSENFTSFLDLRSSIDGKRIVNPENIIFFGLLSSDEKESLYRFNYLVIDKSKLNEWKDRDEFINVERVLSKMRNGKV